MAKKDDVKVTGSNWEQTEVPGSNPLAESSESNTLVAPKLTKEERRQASMDRAMSRLDQAKLRVEIAQSELTQVELEIKVLNSKK